MEKDQPTSVYTRRRFLKASGGIAFLVAAQGILPGCQVKDPETLARIASDLNAWVQVQSDGTVTILNPAAEMGQGSMTALAVIIAEEMDADWANVHIEPSPIEPKTYGLTWSRELGGPMITVGSRTVQGYYQHLRQAGAQARYVLMQAAAGRWEVPLEELNTEPGVVVHEASGRRLPYGEIAAFIEPPATVPDLAADRLKDPAAFRLIGRTLPRFDIPAKVDGTAQYSIDVQLPGMVYGMITRSPAYGARPILRNQASIEALEGVRAVVTLDHGIGVVADTVEQALQAKQALQVDWTEAPSQEHDSQSAYEVYAGLVADGAAGRVLVDTGDVGRTMERAARRFGADYRNDYVYHCQMEPLNAVVSIAEDGRSAEVWAGSQAPDRAREAAAEALGLPFEQVVFHPCYLGGGFGRRSMADYVEEAAQLAKAVQRPLKLLWTREDDLQYGAFRPISLQRMAAAVDENGLITAWSHHIAGPGDNLLASGAVPTYYNIPNQHIAVRAVDHGIRTKHWRSVGHGPNKFAIEAFIDEIATALGIDPVEYRLRLMEGHPRAQQVLRTAAELADWRRPAPAGRARGIAFAERSGSLGAAVCELSVDKNNGQLRVHRFWAALDAGVVVQPDNAIAQMEGGIVMGLSSVLKERITFKNGAVEQSNYHNYPILRISEAPESIDVRLIDSQEAPTGIGESGTPLVAGAVANAFAALTGVRLRHLPFTPEKVLAAMSGKLS